MRVRHVARRHLSCLNIELMLRSVDDLDAPSLSGFLQLWHPAVEVRSVKVRRVHQGTSTHLFLTVEYASGEDGLPAQLFVKTQLDTVEGLPEAHAEALSEGGEGTSLLTNETAFFRDIRPTITVETPQVLVATLVPGPAQFMILAEDLTARGAVFPDPALPLPIDQVASLLDTLAGVHAAVWDSPRLVTGDLKWLDAPLAGPFADFLRGSGFEIIRALLATPYKAALLQRAGLSADKLERAFWVHQELLAGSPITLLHGDPHPGNIYVLPDATVGILDWQLLRRGSWAHDVAYGIIAALAPDDRRYHQQALLRGYLSRLQGLGVNPLPSWDDAWHLYRAGPAWGFAMWAITPGEMYSDALVEAVLERFASAYVDLDTAAVLA